ncbi:unnamed protein product [Owenia fusiformis]|uniref:Uncharacterized protein n=1 Tax=Owenia fusiformis TaxID=6347 RepID=A0A8J1URQ9_OWEFU|nr:unnamed protein product [Owenia fusiformis]
MANVDRLKIFAQDDVVNTKWLASGGFGSVYDGKVKSMHQRVAIKVLKSNDGENLSKSQVESLKSEASHLYNARHPNVVHIFGIVLEPDYYALVMEFCSHGSLRNLLYTIGSDFPLPLKYRILYQVAKAMHFLHQMEPVILHLDLKAGNVLLNEYCEVKICDFGLAQTQRQITSTNENSAEMYSTITHMSPQQLENPKRIQSKEDDVFSFGIFMWEVITGKEPYENNAPHEILVGVVSLDLRPNEKFLPDASTDNNLLSVYKLMKECYADDPTKRPNFDECTTQLEEVYENYHDDATSSATWVMDQVKKLKASGSNPTPQQSNTSIEKEQPLARNVKLDAATEPKFNQPQPRVSEVLYNAPQASQVRGQAPGVKGQAVVFGLDQYDGGAEPQKQKRTAPSPGGNSMSVNISNCNNVMVGSSNVMNVTSHGTSGPPRSSPTVTVKDRNYKLTDRDLNRIAKHVGAEWKTFGRKLGIDDMKLDYIEIDHSSYGLQEQVFQMLRKWKELGLAKAGTLLDACIQLGRGDIIEKAGLAS